MFSRNVDKAREAVQKGDSEASRRAHSAEMAQTAGPEEEHTQGRGKYVKSIVYGGLDGIITTFAVVAGVAGASLSAGVVLILGFANLVADGLSMAVGDYLSTKSENEYNAMERKREEWEVDHYPDGEKQEMVELYTAKGMDKEDAREIVERLSHNRTAWVDVMMVEELGIIEERESPLSNAVATFFSFEVFGFVPLLAYVVAQFFPPLASSSFLLACLLTGGTLFGLGSLKVFITGRNWLISGLEMLVVGGIASAAAYLVGLALSGLA
ncbi:MAG: VIT1/CCC1 transporter family protein [Spirochaeta sp.]|jgi:VIT1/CCC1 family predicted Fe2+/Mn2+ transporter|nr:VIT1/CCC1 transporter family protein [Spirochaeta sp.]